MSSSSWTYLAILLGLVVHGALLPFTYGQTYDAYIHMFFGNHYLGSWFDPWEPRWYTGFSVTAYPPGSHQILGLLMRLMDMRIAFIVLQLIAIALLITGMYRFSRIWVNDKAAAYAALLCAFSTSISETLHIFGQLPTLLSIALFLNAIPHISSWIEKGRKRDFVLGLLLTAATTSVHHVTPLFGTVFFVAPIGLAAFLSNLKQRQHLKSKGFLGLIKWGSPALIRGGLIGVCMLALIITIVFPYWHWSVTDPITQVSIPHGSRENFIENPNLGLMFFVIPWGLLILVVPYVVFKTARTALWPLGLSVLLAMFLGTGGTTPFPRLLLGPAFEILTLDRFTFWSSLLILPFAGLAVQSLWDGRANVLLARAFGAFLSRAGLVFMLVSYAGLSVATALLPTFRQMQPDFIDPAPLVKFMDEDQHSDWRYLTLGFGDQFAYHSALIDAESVDGNYHSARRLPSLMNYSVERLENSKYMGVPGLASLNQFLTNAEKFHLKYVFSNDEFYDPVLHYTGWNPLTLLKNGVRVWEKPGVSALPKIRKRRELPEYQKKMWGTLPIGSLILGFMTIIGLALKQQLISAKSTPFFIEAKYEGRFAPSRRLIVAARIVPLVMCLAFLVIAKTVITERVKPLTPDEVVEKFYQHLDFRETGSAFALIEKNPQLDYGQFLRLQKLTGGLVPSFGKLTSVTPMSISETPESSTDVDVEVKLIYLTSVGRRIVISKNSLAKGQDGHWKIKYFAPDKQFIKDISTTDDRLIFRDLTTQSLIRPTDPVQRLARPNIEVMAANLVQKGDRIYVVGRIKNLSEYPVCTKVMAELSTGNAATNLKQHAGRIGSHRLLPGEDSAFRIDFEGYLKIQDQPLNGAYDPDQFSLPEFETTPSNAELDVSTVLCTPDYYKSLTFNDMKLTRSSKGDTLSVKVSNIGTDIISTMQLKLSYLDDQGRLKWVEPYYLQNNLIPGETRLVNIAVSMHTGDPIGPVKAIWFNGERGVLNAQSLWPSGFELGDSSLEALEGGKRSGQLLIDYDAMIYRPLD